MGQLPHDHQHPSRALQIRSALSARRCCTGGAVLAALTSVRPRARTAALNVTCAARERTAAPAERRSCAQRRRRQLGTQVRRNVLRRALLTESACGHAPHPPRPPLASPARPGLPAFRAHAFKGMAPRGAPGVLRVCKAQSATLHRPPPRPPQSAPYRRVGSGHRVCLCVQRLPDELEGVWYPGPVAQR